MDLPADGGAGPRLLRHNGRSADPCWTGFGSTGPASCPGRPAHRRCRMAERRPNRRPTRCLPSLGTPARPIRPGLDTERDAIAADPVRSGAVDKAKAAGTGSDSLLATSVAKQQPTQGIFADSEAPAPGSIFLGTNRWVGTQNGQTIVVYVGQAGYDASTGRVLVIGGGPSSADTHGFTLDLPNSGPLKAVAGSGGHVTVEDRAGADHVLDLVSQTWLS
jgi:hypothetical protein